MKQEQIFFTIIMPTFNSEKTIGKALESIRRQKFDQSKIEILVIDGGSTDGTLEIAKKYQAVILPNPERVPEAAKRIGYEQARGKWIIKQDSDEVYMKSNQLAKRKKFIDSHPDVYCILTDKLYPGKNCGLCCAYLNYCGDPFSYIVYKLRGSVIQENKKFLFREDTEGNIYQYQNGDRYPIGDGGCTAFDIEKFRELFGEDYSRQEYVNLSTHKLLEETGLMGCIPGDNIYHYSRAGLGTYLKKLRFKIHFNLNGKEESGSANALGYAARAQENPKYSRRKWLFVLYAFSLVLPVFDSIKMALLRRDLSFLLHFVYTYYVLGVIAVEIIRKVLKRNMDNYSYG